MSKHARAAAATVIFAARCIAMTKARAEDRVFGSVSAECDRFSFCAAALRPTEILKRQSYHSREPSDRSRIQKVRRRTVPIFVVC
jgi:hypothetical protein